MATELLGSPANKRSEWESKYGFEPLFFKTIEKVGLDKRIRYKKGTNEGVENLPVEVQEELNQQARGKADIVFTIQDALKYQYIDEDGKVYQVKKNDKWVDKTVYIPFIEHLSIALKSSRENKYKSNVGKRVSEDLYNHIYCGYNLHKSDLILDYHEYAKFLIEPSSTFLLYADGNYGGYYLYDKYLLENNFKSYGYLDNEDQPIGVKEKVIIGKNTFRFDTLEEVIVFINDLLVGSIELNMKRYMYHLSKDGMIYQAKDSTFGKVEGEKSLEKKKWIIQSV